jgi:DNA-binding response OmpR family regulator
MSVMAPSDAPDPIASPSRVLIVEDAPEFLAMLVPLLEGEGYEVRTAADGVAAVDLARSFAPDVIVLDLTLPGKDGLDVCREVRSFSDAYVIMLTARADEVDRVVGLEVGADDYVTKPFSPRELVARVRAMLRRPRATAVVGTSPDVRRFGPLQIDVTGREVTVGGELAPLTKIEFDLLATLSSRPEMVFSRELLRENVWGPDWFGDDHVVDVHIANLRRKIDKEGPGSFLRTVRGVGYRMEDPAAP